VSALDQVADWAVDNAAAAVVTADGAVAASHGDLEHVFHLASVTKPLTAYAVLVAVEEGAIELDTPAGPEGSTVRHLLAHTSGLAFDEERPMAAPGNRRLYSNAGFEVLSRTVREASGIAFADYLRDAVFVPLGMTTAKLTGRAGADVVASAADLVRFAAELQAPTLVSPAMLAEATSVAFPGCNGVLPGYGNHKPNDWGLGVEIRAHKSPHWTGSANSPATFGHFGQSGTFLWVDPAAGVACLALSDRAFGEWAKRAWPALSDAVLAEVGVADR